MQWELWGHVTNHTLCWKTHGLLIYVSCQNVFFSWPQQLQWIFSQFWRLQG